MQPPIDDISVNSPHLMNIVSDFKCRSTNCISAAKQNSIIHLRCTFFNSRSIKNKLPILYALLYSGEYDVVAIVETWLDISVLNSMIDPRGLFNVYRKDRLGRGGGVCICIHKSFHSSEIIIHSKFDVECVIVDILSSKSNVRLFTFYHANTEVSVELKVKNIKIIISCLQHYCVSQLISVVVGDFNCSTIDWNLGRATNWVQELFLTGTVDLGLQQLISSPTRGGNLLDLLFTNE
jgi:hypothetical protein